MKNIFKNKNATPASSVKNIAKEFVGITIAGLVISLAIVGIANKKNIRVAANHIAGYVYASGEEVVDSDIILTAPISASSPKQIGGADNLIDFKNDTLFPAIGPAGTHADIAQLSFDTGVVTTYTVRENDTLIQIAKMFDISPNTIKWQNDLKNDIIRPGQKLAILSADGIEVTVSKGDTISKLASKYKADAEEIKSFNQIEGDTDLKIGAKIFIPGGQPVEVAPSGSSKKGGKSKSTTSKKYAGYYNDPLKGKWRLSQNYHGRWRGIDMAAPTGTPVYASASGKAVVVNKSGWGGGYGTYVVLEHPNGSKTLYAHMSKATATFGGYYKKGELIGYVGSTGRSTGPHLHFEIRNGIDVPWRGWKK